MQTYLYIINESTRERLKGVFYLNKVSISGKTKMMLEEMNIYSNSW
jgi:hypothetical protein